MQQKTSFDYNKELKLKTIEQVLRSMVFSEINTEQISERLRLHLHEKPGIRLNNIREFAINEDGLKTEQKIDKLESIDIVFTVEKEIGGKMIPIPVTYNFKF